jgi:CDP-diacylglycerol--glycerol-3-phosphate 3-phosphatidyltransferase
MTPRVERLPISLALAGVIAITIAAISLPSYASDVGRTQFVVGALPTWLFLVVSLTRVRRQHSPLAHRNAPVAELSAATWVTIGRGFLVSLVAGFALGPKPADHALWLAGGLYTLAALGDRLDGALARRTGRASVMGAALDVTTDAVGLLVAPLVAVRGGRLPPWYLALALAYPAFHLAVAWRRARGLPVFVERLRPDPRARLFAGLQMAVVAASLFPVLPRGLAWAAATVAMLPTLALFAGEWRLVTRSAAYGDARAERLHA